MPRIFKGSESTLRLLIHKCNHYNSISDLKIVLFTGEDIDNHIEVVDGINVDGNMAVITLPARAFNNLEEGVINYIVEGVIDGDLFATERQSNYYLKTPLSYVVDDGLQIKDEYITENGNYTIYPDDTYDGMSQVNLFVEVPDTNGSYDEGYNIGRGEGYNDGYANGQNDGYNSGREEVISQAESLYLTENGVYEGENLYNRVEVAVDVEEQYNKGYEDGANAASADAIVLDVTENGTVYTKFAELPEWTEPETGDDFYSYAKVEAIAYKTQYTPNFDTKVEFWWRKSGTVNLNVPILGITYFGVFPYFSNFYVSLNGTPTYFDINDDNWHHFQLSMKDGFWMDGVQIATYTGTSTYITNAGPIMINGEEVNVLKNSGVFGMIKIDDNIIIPTGDGFKDLNNNELLEMYRGAGNPSYTFEQIEKPMVLDNLIKQVNVNVPIKAYDVETGVNMSFQHSDMTAIPDYINFEGKTNWYRCFEQCKNLQDITALRNIKLNNAENAFQLCSSLTDLSVADTWDFSDCTNMSYMLANSGIVDLSVSSYWNTSKVTNMGNLLNASNLVTVGTLDCTSITGSYSSTPLYFSGTKLKNLGGFLNIKSSLENSYASLSKYPDLTHESYINIFNGLYDFTGNGEKPNSSQGKIKIHSNAYDFLTEDDMAIAINKGWTITA